MSETVRQHPLDLADPDGDPRQLGRERVDLDAEQVLRSNLGELLGDAQHERAPPDGLVFEVLEKLQRDIQEVAAAAGGIEHADGAQAFEEGPEMRSGFWSAGVRAVTLPTGKDQRRDLRLSLGPVVTQRRHQDRSTAAGSSSSV